jgi:hypothetical protein
LPEPHAHCRLLLDSANPDGAQRDICGEALKVEAHAAVLLDAQAPAGAA